MAEFEVKSTFFAMKDKVKVDDTDFSNAVKGVIKADKNIISQIKTEGTPPNNFSVFPKNVLPLRLKITVAGASSVYYFDYDNLKVLNSSGTALSNVIVIENEQVKLKGGFSANVKECDYIFFDGSTEKLNTYNLYNTPSGGSSQHCYRISVAITSPVVAQTYVTFYTDYYTDNPDITDYSSLYADMYAKGFYGTLTGYLFKDTIENGLRVYYNGRLEATSNKFTFDVDRVNLEDHTVVPSTSYTVSNSRVSILKKFY